VLALLPALLFSSFVPGWAPAVALVGLLVLFGLREAALRHSLRSGVSQGGHVVGHTPADWALLLLLLSLPVGLLVSGDLAVSLPRAYAFVANLAIFWAVAAQRDTPWLRHSGWLLLLAGLILGGVFLLGTRFGSAKLPFINREIYGVLPGGLRPFWNPEGFNANLSGGLLALFWAPAVVLAWRGDTWQQRDAAKLVAIALSLLLLLTQSRGALLGCGMALLVITLARPGYTGRAGAQRWGWLLFWLVVLLVIAILAYQLGPGTLLETMLGRSDVFGDRSLQARQELWQRSIDLIRDYPLTGVGLGMVEAAIDARYTGGLVGPDGQFKHAHNVYLQVGAEMGLPGLVGHLALYLILLYLLARRALDRRAGYRQALALALLGSLTVFLTHGFFEVITYATRAAVVVWALFGLMVAVTTSSAGQDEMG
jgi:putative inorganic carbon (HCO3(-)) transporter